MNQQKHKQNIDVPEVAPAQPAQAKSLALELLRHEFSKRMQKNPQYSMRSFAKQLGISHTLLSLVLNGHRKPSRAMAEKIAERLHFSAQKTNSLLASVSRKSEKRGDFVGKGYEKISLDQFAFISEWQHYAILSLLEVADTKFEAKFIAQRLGISQLLAKVSMQRLTSLGIVEQDSSGRWKQRSGPIIVENVKSTVHTRKFQRQLMAKAVESLDNDAMEKRDFSSTTFAMNAKHVSYALDRIREFRRELSNELESFGEPDEVYNLTVQIFPTSKRSKS
jgi:uncharacterized protein (TIGR02147 family)